jgi:hypothetical protein
LGFFSRKREGTQNADPILVAQYFWRQSDTVTAAGAKEQSETQVSTGTID